VEWKYTNQDVDETYTKSLVRKPCWERYLENYMKEIMCKFWINLARDRLHWSALYYSASSVFVQGGNFVVYMNSSHSRSWTFYIDCYSVRQHS